MKSQEIILELVSYEKPTAACLPTLAVAETWATGGYIIHAGEATVERGVHVHTLQHQGAGRDL